jgi:hypothetical protein
MPKRAALFFLLGGGFLFAALIYFVFTLDEGQPPNLEETLEPTYTLNLWFAPFNRDPIAPLPEGLLEAVEARLEALGVEGEVKGTAQNQVRLRTFGDPTLLLPNFARVGFLELVIWPMDEPAPSQGDCLASTYSVLRYPAGGLCPFAPIGTSPQSQKAGGPYTSLTTIQPQVVMVLDSHAVTFELDSEARNALRAYIEAGRTERLALVLDGEVVALVAPKQADLTGRWQIDLALTAEQAAQLSAILEVPPLPAALMMVGMKEFPQNAPTATP